MWTPGSSFCKRWTQYSRYLITSWVSFLQVTYGRIDLIRNGRNDINQRIQDYPYKGHPECRKQWNRKAFNVEESHAAHQDILLFHVYCQRTQKSSISVLDEIFASYFCPVQSINYLSKKSKTKWKSTWIYDFATRCRRNKENNNGWKLVNYKRSVKWKSNPQFFSKLSKESQYQNHLKVLEVECSSHLIYIDYNSVHFERLNRMQS